MGNLFVRKDILLLGASGSIGLQTIDVIKQNKESMNLVAFSVGQNVKVARNLLSEFEIKYCWVQNRQDQISLSQEFPLVNVLCGDEQLIDLVELSQANWVVNALIDFVGFLPTLRAIELNKNIALANKETLVAGGKIVMDAIKKHDVLLTPIDSEHSAIYQCLIGHDIESVHQIYLTASGGAFRDLEHHELAHKTSKDALKHPTWSMGQKITIDSATMMNKGFEVIEAHWLFGFDYDKIKVLIQPESLIHGMVEFMDTSLICQLGSSDMRLPIAMSLNDGVHKTLMQPSLTFEELTSLSLRPIKKGRYPLFELALKMGNLGGNGPAVLNGANEVAVEYYLNDEISYYEMEEAVIYACDKFEYKEINVVNDVLEADAMGRQLAHLFVKGVKYGNV